MQSTWHTGLPVWNLILRASVVYVAIVILLRLSGKREFSQMGMSEFVALLLISNAVQNAMNGGDNSLTGGLILATVLIVWSIALAYITFRWKGAENLIQGRPTLLVHKGKIIEENLKRELMNANELHIVLRIQGVHDVKEVEQAVLESDGHISIIHKTDGSKPQPKAADNTGPTK